MRSNARILPWLLAIAGLAILLILSRMTVWVVVAIWAAGLVLLWVAGGRLNPTPRQRMASAIVALPVLFLLVWEGGWFLIPADVAWLLVESANRARVGRGQTSADARP
jgi:hypothetical protein